MLSRLRLMAGHEAFESNPVDELRCMVADGSWKLTDTCCQCGAGTDDVAVLLCDCEHPSLTGADHHWAVKILEVAFLAVMSWLSHLQFHLLARAEEGREAHGRDVSCTLRFRLCDDCRKAAKSDRGARRFAESIPDLQRLLKKYPDATFRFLKPDEVVGLIQ